MSTKVITTHYTLNGIPRAGLTPHIDIIMLGTTDPSQNPYVATSAPLTEIGIGWYRYDFNSYDSTKSYVFSIDGGKILPASQRYKIGGNESYQEEIASTTWNEVTTAHTQSGTMGVAINEIRANTTGCLLAETAIAVLLNTQLKYERNRTKIDVTNSQLIIYDDDGVTPLTTFALKDFNGMPSVQEVCERFPIR